MSNILCLTWPVTSQVTPGLNFFNFIWKISSRPLHCRLNFSATSIGFRDRWGGATPPPPPQQRAGAGQGPAGRGLSTATCEQHSIKIKILVGLERPCQDWKVPISDGDGPIHTWRTHFMPKRVHLRPERAHPRLYGTHLRPERAHPRLNRAHIRPERVALLKQSGRKTISFHFWEGRFPPGALPGLTPPSSPEFWLRRCAPLLLAFSLRGMRPPSPRFRRPGYHERRGVADGGVGGFLTPALLKTGRVDPPDLRMKWPKSVFSDF